MDLITFTNSIPLDPVFLVRFFCFVCTVVIVVARLVPASRKRFLSYGARVQTTKLANKQDVNKKGFQTTKLLDKLASFDVPHSWFTHFYVLSLMLSLFWLTQITLRTALLRVVSSYVHQRPSAPSGQACTVCVAMMVLQSMRRLWESWRFSQKSKSRMWIGHYVFGLAFYFIVNIAVWIEGVHSILATHLNYGTWVTVLKQPHIGFGLIVYFLAFVAQYLAHAHLASLQKYSIPRQWLFRKLIAPHYTAECALYSALAVMGAPEHNWFNWSLLCVALLTTVNLSITAHNTREWMMAKFRESRGELEEKYCMFPGIW